MIVYAELLFLENFITGWVILMLTGRLRGCEAEIVRVSAGAVMCGTYAFVLFVQMHWLVALVSKILFSAAVTLIVFGGQTIRGLIKTTGIFYIVSFLMGGITIAMMYMLKIPGMTGNGSFVLKGVTFMQIATGVIVTWYLGRWLAGLSRERILKQQVIQNVTVNIGGKELQLKALIDTGNSLKDPITGQAVAVLSKDASERVSRECDSEQFNGFVAIPYRSVDRSGVMFGIRPDSVKVGDSEEVQIILAFSKRNFSPWKGTEKYDLLLHQQFLEGEEHDYGEKFDSAGC